MNVITFSDSKEKLFSVGNVLKLIQLVGALVSKLLLQQDPLHIPKLAVSDQ